MKDKYYMRDLMERFHVGRNTIKYYEKQGIIKGIREENGYRSYSYLDMKRIERVFILRDMGFTIEQIKRFLSGLSMEGELGLNKERIHMLEMQIASLKAELEFIKYMDHSQRMIPEYYKQYQVCEDFELCFGCNKNKEIESAWFMKREMKVLYFDKEFTIEREEYHENVAAQQTIQLSHICRECDSELIVKGPVVHGIIKMSQMEKVPSVFQEICHEMEKKGYQMEYKMYCLYDYYIEADPKEEGIAIKYYIPIKTK